MIAEQLKKSILQAAIQGKLTQQLPEDGDARDLLKEIQKEKARLIKEGKIKKEKPLPIITEDEIPFEIPENWCWVRLGEIVEVKGGKRIPVGSKLTKKDTGHKYIRVADMHNDTVLSHDVHYVPENIYPSIKNYTISSNDIYITVAGSIGRIGKIPDEFDGANLTENADKLVFNHVDINWLMFALQSPLIQSQISDATTKVGQPKLAIKKIETLIVPLQPHDEQIRVVERINNFIIEIESLKNDEARLEELQKSFPKKMKDAILQYAIQGKLTQQLPEDGDARDLLKDIQKEKARLIKEGKIKKEKPLPEITEDEIPFEIPENWCWVRLGEITDYGVGKQVSAEKIQPNSWILELEDIEKETFKLTCKRFDREPGSSKNAFSKGCVLYGKLRPYLKKVIIADESGYCSTEIIPFNGYGNINSSYLKYCMVAPSIDSNINQITHGMDMPRLGTDKAKLLFIPLPPLAEQKRIVACLEGILPFCEGLQ
ncbi:MAG: hypothetical protein CVV54_07025 [Synergistetes bacterium HGW-Synergistetes-1]|nr:MAG: hypothetical protein CVV54_07025 [Synergistetes bacterium HGW-Synergistetes-1]